MGYECNVLGRKDGEVSLTFAEMESLIRQGRLSRHSLLVHLRTFLGSEIFYSSCDEEDAILKDIVAAHISIISASLYPGMPYSATHTATTGSHNCRVSVIPVRTAHCSIHTCSARRKGHRLLVQALTRTCQARMIPPKVKPQIGLDCSTGPYPSLFTLWALAHEPPGSE